MLIFARAPRLGAVKRRLARGVGARAALRFHLATLENLARAVRADRRLRPILVLTPDRARLRLRVRLPVLPQGGGDLGARMQRVARRFPRRRVYLIGCDIPGAGPADIHAARRGLGRAHAVFGPAEDGGFWLVGFGPRRPARPFQRVRWSTRHALADTLRNFPDKRVALLPPRRDVDTAEDLWTTRSHRWAK